MDAAEFEGLLYNILSEELFKNQRVRTTEEKDDYTISDYVSQHFGMLFGETTKCFSCHQNKRLKVLNEDLFILSFGRLL